MSIVVITTTLCFLSSVFVQAAQQMEIVNYAGTASYTAFVDESPATSSYFTTQPYGIEIDSVGDIYVGTNSVYKIKKSDGSIKRIAGGGSSTDSIVIATSASYYLVTDLKMDKAGDKLHIVNRGRDINTMDLTTNIVTRIAGNTAASSNADGQAATATLMTDLYSFVQDTVGNIFFGEAHRIRKINLSGIITGIAGYASGTHGDGSPGNNGKATSAGLCHCFGLVIDASGENLYLAEYCNGFIRKYNFASTIISIAGGGGRGVTEDFNGLPATSAHFNHPVGIWMSPSGNVVFTDQDNHNINMFSTTGPNTVTRISGSPLDSYGYGGDGLAFNNLMYSPSGIVGDGAERLYFADSNNRRVRHIYPTCYRRTVTEVTVTIKYEDDGSVLTSHTYVQP